MSDPNVNIGIVSSYNASGTNSAAQGLLGVGKQASAAEKQLLSYAAAQAKIQSAQGNAAGAAQTMNHALAQVDKTSLQAARAAGQLQQSLNQVSKASSGASVYAKQFGTAFRGELLSIVGPAAAAGAAIAAIRKGGELAQLGAQADLVGQRFNSMAAAAGTSGDAILNALRKASGGELSTLDIQLASNKANLLGVADSAGELATLMEIARDRAQAMGISTQFAFDSIVTGLGRGSALILDNIGITVEAAEINAQYAASVGKNVQQLTEQEKKQALINAVIAQGNATLATTGGALNSTAGSFAALGAASENAQAALGKLVAKLLEVPAQVTTKVLIFVEGGISQITEADANLKQIAATAVEVSKTYEEYGQKQAFVNQQLAQLGITQGPVSQAQFEYAKSLMESGQAAEQAYDAAIKYAYAIEAGTQASTVWGEGQNDLRDTLIQLSGVSEYYATAVASLSQQYLDGGITGDTYRAAIAALAEQQAHAAEMAAYESFETQRLTQTHVDAALAAQNSAAQSLIDAAAKEEEAAKTELLRLQTQAAVEEFLRLNPTLSATQVAAVGAANGLSPLQIQLAQTAIRAGEAQRALSAFQQQAAIGAGIGGLTPLRGLKERGPVGGALGQGANSSEAGQTFRQRALINSYYPTVVAPTRGGGGGDGSSAASKMDNARVAEMQKTEDAERAHQQRLVDIEKEFSEKAGQQAKKNEVGKRKSRADFYDNLTKATGDIGGEAAQKLAGDYEAAYAEAQKIAQAGNHKLAADYLSMKQDQINAEVDYQQEVARAREEGNTAEVSRLEAIQAMRASANQEELKQLTEGGDSIVNERDKALSEEGAKYEEQTAKIETAAQRKEDALVRSSANSAQAVSSWADQVEEATRRATNALNSVPKVPSVTAPGGIEDGTEAETGAPAGGQGIRGGRGLAGGARAAGGGSAAAVATIAEANAVIEQILALGGIAKKFIKPLQLYQQTLGTALDLLTTVADFHSAAAASVAAPIEVATIQRLVDEARAVLDLTVTKLVPYNERQVTIFENYNKAVGGSIGILSDMAGLRQTLSDALRDSQPFDMVAVNWLVRRAAEFTALVQSSLLPLTEKQADALDQYASGVGASISIIGDLASLRQQMTEAMRDSSPFDAAQIAFLIGRAKQFTAMVIQQLIPLTEDQAAALERYASGVGAAVSIIAGLAGLRQTVTEAMEESAPFDAAQIAFLIGRAKQFTDMVLKQLLPLTQEQSDALTRYADGVGASAQIISDMAGLRKELSEPLPALDDAMLLRLAQDSQRLLRIMEGVILPATEEQAAAAQRYADTVGAAASALAAPMDLSANLFADYQSPSDAQLSLLARDAQRIADWMIKAAAMYETTGLEAAKLYSETVGNTFSAFNEGLVFLDRLRYTDLAVNPAHLATFQQSTMSVLDTMERLGARAAQIPAANISALQNSAAATMTQMDALIRMTAVPWGDVPAAAAGYAQQGGAAAGGGGITIMPGAIVIQGAGQNADQIANQVIQRIQQRTGSHR